MKIEKDALVIVFPRDIVLSDAEVRSGPRCARITVKKGAYYARRISNPMKSGQDSWIVLYGTRIGMVESILLAASEVWMPDDQIIFLFEPNDTEVTRFRVNCERPVNVEVFSREVM